MKKITLTDKDILGAGDKALKSIDIGLIEDDEVSE